MKSRAPLNEPALPRRRLYGHPFAIGYKKRLARSNGEKVAEAIADWVAVVREELRADGEIAILAIAFDELARQFEQAENAGFHGLGEVIRKQPADCAAAVLRAEDMSRSGPNSGIRSVIERPHGKANRNNPRFTPARRAA